MPAVSTRKIRILLKNMNVKKFKIHLHHVKHDMGWKLGMFTNVFWTQKEWKTDGFLLSVRIERGCNGWEVNTVFKFQNYDTFKQVIYYLWP